MHPIRRLGRLSNIIHKKMHGNATEDDAGVTKNNNKINNNDSCRIAGINFVNNAKQDHTTTSDDSDCEEPYEEYATFLPVRMGNVQALAMLDTGNTYRTAINRDMADKLGLTKKDIKPLPGYQLGTAAIEGNLEVLGECRKKLRLNLGGNTRDINCKPLVIGNLSMAINISGPFQRKHSIDILANGHAQFQGRQVPLQAPDESLKHFASSHSLVYITKDTTVEAETGMYLPAVAAAVHDGSMASDSLCVVGDGSFTDKLDLHPTVNGILPCGKDGDMNVPVLNTTTRNIKIKKGTLYGAAFATTTPDKMKAEPFKICLLERPAHLKAEPKQHPKQQQQPDDPKDPPMDMSLETYMDGKKLPSFMLGRTNKYNTLRRTAFLMKFFKLDANHLLKDKKDMAQVIALLLDYWDIWAFDGSYGRTNLLEHRIDVEPGTRPIYERYRPCNPLLEDDMKQQIDKWLRHDIIEKSNSPWNFSLVAAVKKNNRIRWCTDWRALNRVTIKGI